MGGQVVYTLWLRDMKWLVRAKARLATTIVMPFLWLGIIGVGLNSVFVGRSFLFAGEQMPYLEFMAPGIIGMTLLFSGTFAGVSVVWDKQFGFMKEILVAPVSRLSIMLGKILGGATASILQGFLLLGATALVGVELPGGLGILQALAFMGLISVSFVSIGLAFAARIEDPHTFPLVTNFFIMPLFFLSGALYTIRTAPGWLQTLAYLNPMTYGIDGLRASILGVSQFSIWLDLWVLLAFALAVFLIGSYLFKRMTG
ncbi:MAG: ABC transporter permease [Candidatus Hadarchaeota archaeon]|nr:ABC transporter permease [Candidatus Hadarchaeota archaeon]